MSTSRLVQPQGVAEAVLGVLHRPPPVTVEGIVLLPSSGRL
jgi:NADP-dependent 3-hydroxy acid dehydrogenase YdfG